MSTLPLMVLTAVRKEEIEQCAERLLRKHFGRDNTLRYPVRVQDIVENEGLKWGGAALSEWEPLREEKNVIGVYFRKDNKALFEIDMPFPRKMFTLAKMLGHHLLHPDVDLRVLFGEDMREEVTDEMEAEANWFAGALVMPREDFEFFWKLYGGVLKPLTKRMGISPRSAEVRAKFLGVQQ